MSKIDSWTVCSRRASEDAGCRRTRLRYMCHCVVTGKVAGVPLAQCQRPRNEKAPAAFVRCASSKYGIGIAFDCSRRVAYAPLISFASAASRNKLLLRVRPPPVALDLRVRANDAVLLLLLSW